MLISFLAIVAGLAVLVWSADKFVDGAAVTARHFNIPPLVIGMVIIGFGTSAPELVVSAIASSQGNPGIALGNAYGSNITNIALILGIAALISPILVDSQILRKTLPILTVVTLLAAWQLLDDRISRLDAIILLLVFFALMAWTVVQGRRDQRSPLANDSLGNEIVAELDAKSLPLRRAVLWTITGLLLLIASSRLLVWGAVGIAQDFGVSDLIIGLTVIAVGTSLPELASCVISARKGEHDMALGNILGSNLFNTLAVVGIAGVIHPMGVGHEVLTRDMLVMVALTVSLFFIGYGFRTQGSINRWEGAVLVSVYVAYSAWLISSVLLPS
jgi:cation:H+ antiporter